MTRPPARSIVRQAAADAQRAARAQQLTPIAQNIADAWARVAELRDAGLDVEADFVEAQAREMEAK